MDQLDGVIEMANIIADFFHDMAEERRIAEETAAGHPPPKTRPKSRPGAKWGLALPRYKRRENMRVFKTSKYQQAINLLLTLAHEKPPQKGLCIREIRQGIDYLFAKMEPKKIAKLSSIYSALDKLRKDDKITANMEEVQYPEGTVTVLVYRIKR